MNKHRTKLIQRGDIYIANLSPVTGSEQGGIRPVLIIQNNTGNRHSPTLIAAAITGQFKGKYTGQIPPECVYGQCRRR